MNQVTHYSILLFALLFTTWTSATAAVLLSENESTRCPAFLGVTPSQGVPDVGYRINVKDQTSAARIGLEDGDILMRINGERISSWGDITASVAALYGGDSVRLVIFRKGEQRTFRGRIGVSVDCTEGQPFLGINRETISREKAEWLGYDNANGTYVSKVLKGSAAEKAGVRIFDYLVGIDEYRVGDQQDISAILRKYMANDRVQLHVIRKKKRLTIPVVLGRKSDVVNEMIDECDEAFFGVEKQYNAQTSSKTGVVVTVVANSTARELGMTSGVRVVEINGQSIYDWTDLSIAVNNLRAGELINVLWETSNGDRVREEMPIKAYRDTKNCNERVGTSFDFDFDFDFDNMVDEICREVEDAVDGVFQGRSSKGSQSQRFADPVVPIADLNVKLEAPTSADRETMRTKGVDMPIDGILPVEGLRIFPNPTVGKFNISFSLPNKGTTAIRAYNSAGRMIYDFELGNFQGQFDDTIDISQNGTGTYFLMVEQNGKTFTKKVILQGR